ncbi:hypothetical protein WMF18_16245 [Sorangium sp. So ce315]|uniref:hypothetical protein n=1 Tax=Sorangium sp. So ce315 TaxID=3133299 RepID=UPI003F617798
MNRCAIVRGTERFGRNLSEIRWLLEEAAQPSIAGDTLLLHTLGGGRIHLLAIRHHRQRSFDVQSHRRR